MAHLIAMAPLLMALPGWSGPEVPDPVARATVVGDHVLLPVFHRDGLFTLISDGRKDSPMRLDILDQLLHRSGPAIHLRHDEGGAKKPVTRGLHPVAHIRIDHQRMYYTTQRAFLEGDPLDQQPIGLLINYYPLEIVRFLRSDNASMLDKETRFELSKVTARHFSPSVGFRRKPGDPRIQFDFFPGKGDRFELYFSGMFVNKLGGERRYHIYKTSPVQDPEGVNISPDHGDHYWETPRAKDWEEGFTVVGVAEDRYFVTHAGRLFAAPREKSADRKLKPLRTEHPIRILINDTEFHKTYAFTGSTYFEIGDPVNPIPHQISIPGVPGPLLSQDGLKAMEVITKCARVLRGLPERVSK